MGICTATTRLTISPYEPLTPEILCMKITDDLGRHLGDHQGIHQIRGRDDDPTAEWMFERKGFAGYNALVSWSEGGASSHKFDPSQPNTNCMCATNAHYGHAPEDHSWKRCVDCTSIFDSKSDVHVRCDTCNHWRRRVEEVRAGKQYLRPHEGMSAGRIYTFSARSPHGFGGARFTITMDDGTVVAKDQAGLWDGGAVPWWVDDDLPPNCTIESGSGTTKVPGHTTSSVIGNDGEPMGIPLRYTGGPEPTS